MTLILAYLSTYDVEAISDRIFSTESKGASKSRNIEQWYKIILCSIEANNHRFNVLVKTPNPNVYRLIDIIL